jgi:hypothetical protein
MIRLVGGRDCGIQALVCTSGPPSGVRRVSLCIYALALVFRLCGEELSVVTARNHDYLGKYLNTSFVFSSAPAP